MRGNPAVCGYDGGIGGSIPAYAGEPPVGGGNMHSGEVYPRVCGGTGCGGPDCGGRKGLSPRMRGNPPQTTSPHG